MKPFPHIDSNLDNTGQEHVHEMIHMNEHNTPAKGAQPASPHDRQALYDIGELFELHFDMLWRLAKRQGLSDADADDAIQETYLIAAEKVGDFEGKSQIRTWLCGILMRVCWRSNTGKSKRTRLIAKIKTSFLPTAHRDESALEYEPLYKALNSLPEKQREALWLVDVEGFSLKELSQVACVPLHTAASRVREGRKTLSKKAIRLGMR